MSVGIWQLIIVLIIILILFGGRGKISSILADLGKGFKAFKKEVKDTNSKKNKDD